MSPGRAAGTTPNSSGVETTAAGTANRRETSNIFALPSETRFRLGRNHGSFEYWAAF